MTTLARLSLACLLFAVAPPGIAQAKPVNASASSLTAAFNGTWVGVLQYRDYASDASVSLPAWLTMTASPDGSSVELAYLFDDGPSKSVREQAALTFDTIAATATLRSGEHTDQYEVKGLGAFQRAGGRGTLTLTGTGTENGKPVYTRIVLTLDRNLYSWRRETRPQDGPETFRVRDAYTFTRERPAP